MPLNMKRQEKELKASLKESMDSFDYTAKTQFEQVIKDGNLQPVADYMQHILPIEELYAVNQHADQLIHFYHTTGITAFAMVRGVEKTSIQPK